jgi:LDH2 family malate/lactate/ureidoglycolate dehydrogenase
MARVLSVIRARAALRFITMIRAGVVDAIPADLRVRYPGERTLDTRRRSAAEGIPVEPSIWQLVQTYV